MQAHTGTTKARSTSPADFRPDDPIHAALSRHRNALRQLDDLLVAMAGDRKVAKAADELDRAAIALAKTVPTSWAGLFDTLMYLRDAGDPAMFWPAHADDRKSYAQVMFDSLYRGRLNILADQSRGLN